MYHVILLMLFIQSVEDKYIKTSDYIYNNFDDIITKNNDIKKYIEESTDLIQKYQKIWQDLEYKRIISNIIALNLFIINNFE
jgi:hypothetical protein